MNNEELRRDAITVIKSTIEAVLPDNAVKNALMNKDFKNKDIYIVSIGKAAWNMAKAASTIVGSKMKRGIVVTKYDHANGPIDRFEIIEAGHPVPDSNSVIGAEKTLEMISNLSDKDQIILLISGGGSSLFEKPLGNILLTDTIDVTEQLLACGADIVEINTVRKHMSSVKGGRLAQSTKANIYSIVLSDVIGDKLDFIASGPVYPDSSTSEDALRIIEKYGITADESVFTAIQLETPKELFNIETIIGGSVSKLCEAAAKSAEKLGYRSIVLSSTLECEAKEAGKFIGSIARELATKEQAHIKRPTAIIVGGETVVHLLGTGDGGRNQEIALSCALEIEGLKDVVVFSLGSDGTDGPTDAAGGIVDGNSIHRMKISGMQPEVELDNNNSYHALKASGDLLITGATGTNVNDVTVILIK